MKPTPKPKTPTVQAPVPIREPRYWLEVTESQCLALADGVVTPEVQAMAGLVDRNPVPGLQPYGSIFTQGQEP